MSQTPRSASTIPSKALFSMDLQNRDSTLSQGNKCFQTSLYHLKFSALLTKIRTFLVTKMRTAWRCRHRPPKPKKNRKHATTLPLIAMCSEKEVAKNDPPPGQEEKKNGQAMSLLDLLPNHLLANTLHLRILARASCLGKSVSTMTTRAITWQF